MRVSLRVALLGALSLVGCGEDAATRQRRAEGRILKRQIENLEEMIEAARTDRLVDPKWIAVAVDEAAVKTVIQAGLPVEAEIGGHYRVRVEKAEVSFRSGSGLVSLSAHVVDERRPEGLKVGVVYRGGLDDVAVGPDGRLRGRLVIDDVGVPEAEAAGADAAAVARMLHHLAGRNMEALQSLLPSLAIPVRVQQGIAFDGLGEGPVEVDAGDLPMTASVTRLVPLSGRLWVLLDVKVGPWRERAAGTPRAKPS